MLVKSVFAPWGVWQKTHTWVEALPNRLPYSFVALKSCFEPTTVANIEIGNNVHIGNNAHISGLGGLYIGDNTHISRNLLLYTDNHHYKGKYLPYDNTYIKKKVIIERNVWVGMNVVILPGSHIKEGAIIGAGAVVSGVVESLAIYGASLGKVINARDEEHYNQLEDSNQYGAISGKKLSNECK